MGKGRPMIVPARVDVCIHQTGRPDLLVCARFSVRIPVSRIICITMREVLFKMDLSCFGFGCPLVLSYIL